MLALNVLARITQRARQSEYVGVVEVSVVGKLLEAGVPMLLRYALDDSNDAVFYVAIHALHSLLVLTPEEVRERVQYFIVCLSLLDHKGGNQSLWLRESSILCIAESKMLER